MRLILALAALIAALSVSPAFAEHEKDKGALEKAGEYVDESVKAATDLVTDSAITARIKNRLFKDDYVSGLHIRITTREGIVIVEGKVDSEALAKRAMDIVRATRGVKGAENHMRVVTVTHSQVK